MLTKNQISKILSNVHFDSNKEDIISTGSVKNIVVFDKEIVIDLLQEEENKIVYYHRHHSNPCVVGAIHKRETVKMSDGSMHKGIKVIIITHNIICEDYDDNLSDITKVWDRQTQSEVCNRRYDTDPDTCIQNLHAYKTRRKGSVYTNSCR